MAAIGLKQEIKQQEVHLEELTDKEETILDALPPGEDTAITLGQLAMRTEWGVSTLRPLVTRLHRFGFLGRKGKHNFKNGQYYSWTYCYWRKE